MMKEQQKHDISAHPSRIDKVNEKFIREYGDLKISYLVTDDSKNPGVNDMNYHRMRTLLSGFGIDLTLSSNGILSIAVDPRELAVTQNRYAGRPPAHNEEYVEKAKKLVNKKGFFFSDVIHLHEAEGLTFVAIRTALDMKKTTFHDHWYKMTDTDYYRSIDRTRLDDLEYLKSIPGDEPF